MEVVTADEERLVVRKRRDWQCSTEASAKPVRWKVLPCGDG
jgi:hypothetical protein